MLRKQGFQFRRGADRPAKEPEPEAIVPALREIAALIFPRLAMSTPKTGTGAKASLSL